jgi:hypothetical protein
MTTGFIQGQDLPDLGFVWKDNSGAIRDFSSGWTFTVQIGNSGDDALIVKTTGITGAATSPNVTVSFSAGELDGLPAGVYVLQLIARRNSDSKDDFFAPQTFVMSAGMTSAGSLAPITGGSIDLLSDVDVTGAALNAILRYDGTNWVDSYPGSFDGTRVTLSTDVETGPGYDNEVVRLDAENIAAKPAIAYRDSTGQTKAWLQLHDYLHDYATLTFAAASVDTTNNRIATTDITADGTLGFNWRTVEYATLTTTGSAPAGLTAGSAYYVRKSGGYITFHISAAAANAGTGAIDITTQGTGTHTLTPDQTYANNRHKHFSVELADASGIAMQTRISIPYDYDTTELGFFSSNVNVNDGILRVVGAGGTNRQLQFGGTPSDNLAPDGTNIRFAIVTDSTTESGSNAGSDFKVTRYSDTGVALDAPFFMQRSTGFIGLGGYTAATPPTAQLEVGTSGTNAIRIRRGANTNFASFVLGTTTSDKWNIQLRSDSTDHLHLRDAANGRSLIELRTTGQALVGHGLALKRTTVADAAYTTLATDSIIAYTSLTASRIVTLSSANAITGQTYRIKDESGSCAGGVTITVTPSSGTIDGAASKVLNSAYAFSNVYFNGTNWYTI